MQNLQPLRPQVGFNFQLWPAHVGAEQSSITPHLGEQIPFQFTVNNQEPLRGTVRPPCL